MRLNILQQSRFCLYFLFDHQHHISTLDSYHTSTPLESKKEFTKSEESIHSIESKDSSHIILLIGWRIIRYLIHRDDSYDLTWCRYHPLRFLLQTLNSLIIPFLFNHGRIGMIGIQKELTDELICLFKIGLRCQIEYKYEQRKEYQNHDSGIQ